MILEHFKLKSINRYCVYNPERIAEPHKGVQYCLKLCCVFCVTQKMTNPCWVWCHASCWGGEKNLQHGHPVARNGKWIAFFFFFLPSCIYRRAEGSATFGCFIWTILFCHWKGWIGPDGLISESIIVIRDNRTTVGRVDWLERWLTITVFGISARHIVIT